MREVHEQTPGSPLDLTTQSQDGSMSEVKYSTLKILGTFNPVETTYTNLGYTKLPRLTYKSPPINKKLGGESHKGIDLKPHTARVSAGTANERSDSQPERD